MRFLIVGSNGFIGSELMKCLDSLGIEKVGCSLADFPSNSQMSRSIDEFYSHFVSNGISHAIITSSVTDYLECEKNLHAVHINTVLVPKLVINLLLKGIKVNYISSNTVFGGNYLWPSEKHIKNPKIAYAVQKSTAEDKLLSTAKNLNMLNLLSITRLTKVVSREIAPFKFWLENMASQTINEPFRDLIFAPITKKFAAENLIRISIKDKSGVFHLSGKKNISYYGFCKLLYDEMGISKNLINPIDSIAMDIERFYFPKWSGLGMKVTNSLVGISPQPTQDVVRYLSAE